MEGGIWQPWSPPSPRRASPAGLGLPRDQQPVGEAARPPLPLSVLRLRLRRLAARRVLGQREERGSAAPTPAMDWTSLALLEAPDRAGGPIWRTRPRSGGRAPPLVGPDLTGGLLGWRGYGDQQPVGSLRSGEAASSPAWSPHPAAWRCLLSPRRRPSSVVSSDLTGGAGLGLSVRWRWRVFSRPPTVARLLIKGP